MKLLNSNLRPEEFPLRSTESRAAARALLKAREEVTICVKVICVGRQEGDPPLPATEHTKYDGGVIEIAYVGCDASSERERVVHERETRSRVPPAV